MVALKLTKQNSLLVLGWLEQFAVSPLVKVIGKNKKRKEKWLGFSLFQKMKRLEKNGLRFNTKIVNRTTNFIFKKVSNVPRNLVSSFVKQRIFVRIKYINMKKN